MCPTVLYTPYHTMVSRKTRRVNFEKKLHGILMLHLSPIESDFVLEMYNNEQISLVLTHLLIGLPSPFKALMMLPLHLYQGHHLVAQVLHPSIQNGCRRLHIVQMVIHLKVIYRYHC